jgi:hypothetical protein
MAIGWLYSTEKRASRLEPVVVVAFEKKTPREILVHQDVT